MAAAKKCDRCGKYYDYDGEVPKGLRVCKNLKGLGSSFFDLCQMCTLDLESFMHGWPDIHNEENMNDCVEEKENESN